MRLSSLIIVVVAVAAATATAKQIKDQSDLYIKAGKCATSKVLLGIPRSEIITDVENGTCKVKS